MPSTSNLNVHQTTANGGFAEKSDDEASVTVKKRGQMGAAWLTRKCVFLWKERP
jgi:hypothetical protein